MDASSQDTNDNVLHELDDAQTEKVAGGYLFNASVLAEDHDPEPWQILDDQGDVVARWANREWAVIMAGLDGYSAEELTWEQVQRLRETGSPY